MPKYDKYILILIINICLAQMNLLNYSSNKLNPFIEAKNYKKENSFKFIKNISKNSPPLRQLAADKPDSKIIYFILLLILILIVVIALLIVIIIIMCKKKEYPSYQNISEESNKLNAPHNNIVIDESNDTKDFSEVKVVDDTKVTSEEVKFLKNIMKKTHK